MRFQNPQIFMFIPAMLLMIILWFMTERSSLARLNEFLSTEMLNVLRMGYSATRKKNRMFLLLVAAILGVVALARPQMGTREESLTSQGLDVVFMIDVSNSMLTEDVVPSRLKKAKHIVKNFLDHMSGDRVGIVAFAGSAYPAVPMTTDYEYVKQNLDVIDESSISNQGTDLAKALKISSELLSRGALNEQNDPSEESEIGGSGSRVIIVLSDGEDTVGEEKSVASQISKNGIRVYTIGIGSLKGAPIPMRDETGGLKGYKKDKSGGMVLTRLESKSLEAISSASQSKYYPASTDEGEVQEILNELTGMDRNEGNSRKVIVYDEYFQYPLFLSVLFTLIALSIRESKNAKKRKTRIAEASLLFFLLMSGTRQAQATGIGEYNETKEGIKAYESKDYPEAIRRFGKAQVDNPDSSDHHLNLGDALFKSGSYENSVKEFSEAAKSKEVNESAKAGYNLGKSYGKLKEREKEIQSYQSSLDRMIEDPNSDPQIIEKLKRALETAQSKQKQEKEQSKDQKKGGEGKDQKKNDQQNKDEGKDQNKKNEENDKKDEQKNYKNPKPQFKADKVTESDAKRIMKQLQEQEKKTTTRMMRQKTGKPKDHKNDKDW